jgi:hypothetical protein
VFRMRCAYFVGLDSGSVGFFPFRLKDARRKKGGARVGWAGAGSRPPQAGAGKYVGIKKRSDAQPHTVNRGRRR